MNRIAYSCSESEFVTFRQDMLRQAVNEVADAGENGAELLRQGAIAQLEHDDPKQVDRALAVLFVVGTAGDVAVIEPLLVHFDEGVRKAARTCMFELRRRPVDNGFDSLAGNTAERLPPTNPQNWLNS